MRDVPEYTGFSSQCRHYGLYTSWRGDIDMSWSYHLYCRRQLCGMYESTLAFLAIVVLAYILVGGAILIFPGPIIYIVGDSHERCMEVH